MLKFLITLLVLPLQHLNGALNFGNVTIDKLISEIVEEYNEINKPTRLKRQTTRLAI